jgi:hypothetical protein
MSPTKVTGSKSRVCPGSLGGFAVRTIRQHRPKKAGVFA